MRFINTQKGSRGQRIAGKFWMMLKWGMGHINILKFYRTLEPIKNQLGLVNMELAKMDQNDPLTVRRLAEFDHAMILLCQGKWGGSKAIESGQKEDWKQAFAALKVSAKFAQTLLDHATSGSTEPIPFSEIQLTDKGTEISFAGETPLLPSISPVVILQGSDLEMGYQYAQQLVQIFGSSFLQKSPTGSHHCGVLRAYEFHAGEVAGENRAIVEQKRNAIIRMPRRVHDLAGDTDPIKH